MADNFLALKRIRRSAASGLLMAFTLIEPAAVESFCLSPDARQAHHSTMVSSNMAHASMISPSPTARRSAHEWLAEEHALYVEALELFPDSQWKVIAAYVGTRTTRQVMTHAHKIAQKKKRHERGLRPSGRPHGDATTRRTPRRTAKPTSVTIPDETLDDDAKPSSPCCPTTAHFLDMFEFDALLDLDSVDHELLWTDQPSKSPNSPAGSIFTSSVFGERVGGLDVDNVDRESFFRTL